MSQALNESTEQNKDSKKEEINENIQIQENEINNILDSPIQKGKNEINKNEDIKESLKEIQTYSDNKNSNKSTSIERQDISEDYFEPLTSTKKYKNNKNIFKNEIIKKKSKKKSIDFTEYLSKMKEYEKKKADKILEMKKQLEKNEIKDLKPKPDISKKSKQIVNNKNKKENLFERMKEKERIANERKSKLIEQINTERAKKKEEEDKPLEFKNYSKHINKKFSQMYYEMKKKDDQKKEQFKVFAEVIKQYETRECKFQPNLNDDEEETEAKPKHKKLNSCELVQRLYNDELKNRIKKKENLEQKYKFSFKPHINDISTEMANRFKKRMKNKKDENKNKNDISEIGYVKRSTKRLNNSAIKKSTKKMDIILKKREQKEDKNNITDFNIENKNNENNIYEKIDASIINENNSNAAIIENKINEENNDNNKKEEIKEKENNENNN